MCITLVTVINMCGNRDWFTRGWWALPGKCYSNGESCPPTTTTTSVCLPLSVFKPGDEGIFWYAVISGSLEMLDVDPSDSSKVRGEGGGVREGTREGGRRLYRVLAINNTISGRQESCQGGAGNHVLAIGARIYM